MIDNKTRVVVIERDSSTCQDCGHVGETGNRKDEIQVHHIEPERLGGSDSMDNLIALCGKCHSIREIELRKAHPGRTSLTAKIFLTLAMEPEAVEAFDAEVALLKYETSRASAMRSILKAWTAAQAKKRTRKVKAS